MAKLGSVPKHSIQGKSDVIVSLCSLGVMLCMVMALLGIKFRWFKKRIHFDQIPAGSSGSDDNGQVVLRRSSRNFQEHFSEPVVVQGIFRKKLDEDVIIERPTTLPPVRVRKTSKGPTTFGPPKRTTIPSTVVEETVVIPPPPPPLPSASSLSLSTLGGSTHHAVTEDKVNFAPSVQIISNGNKKMEPETEPLNTEEAQMSRQLSERKQTGYTRPSDEIIAELQKLSDEVSKKQNFEEEAPEPLPRTITPEKSKEKFKKNYARPSVQSTTAPQNPEEEQNDVRKLGHRRLTGIFPSPDEDLKDYRDLSDDDDDDDDDDDKDDQKPSNHKVIFQVDDIDDERKPPPSLPLTSPPIILFSSQISNDEEPNSPDGWSAIQRHRNLTQEINDHQEFSTNKEELSLVAEFQQHPHPTTQPEKPKPRTMRDMKRNNARNDLLLNSERDYN